jgi:hypothetical protein
MDHGRFRDTGSRDSVIASSARLLLVVGAILLLPTCRAPETSAAGARPSAPFAASTSTAPVASTSAAPAASASVSLPSAGGALPFDVGPNVTVSAFAPGHYAVDLRYRHVGTHARNWYRLVAHNTFVLDAAADGGVTACRGARSLSTNDGPTVHDRIALQAEQGYRGRWVADGSAVRLELDPVPDVCPVDSAYQDRAPGSWRLGCASLEPRGHVTLPSPVLACRLEPGATLDSEERWGYFVADVLPGEWLLLGHDQGIVITGERDSDPARPLPWKLTIAPSPAPVRWDGWNDP